jgi:hypothetical protein
MLKGHAKCCLASSSGFVVYYCVADLRRGRFVASQVQHEMGADMDKTSVETVMKTVRLVHKEFRMITDSLLYWR